MCKDMGMWHPPFYYLWALTKFHLGWSVGCGSFVFLNFLLLKELSQLKELLKELSQCLALCFTGQKGRRKCSYTTTIGQAQILSSNNSAASSECWGITEASGSQERAKTGKKGFLHRNRALWIQSKYYQAQIIVVLVSLSTDAVMNMHMQSLIFRSCRPDNQE